jgi:DNA-directed RNA polymerase specialized sigma24 family protein
MVNSMTNSKRVTLEDALRNVREKYHARIIAELKSANLTYREIASLCGVSEQLVYNLSRMRKFARSRTASAADISEEESQ